MRRHLLYLSTTGGGKSVTLLTYSISLALVMGSGYSYTDGKAQLDLAVAHASSCLRFNRALDFLCISYITGGIDIWVDDGIQKTNTFNFYATASYSEISEVNIALLDGDNDVWAKRAESFISALSKILVYLRDNGEIELSVESYLNIA
jgi:intracellular multiplication protein IcmO